MFWFFIFSLSYYNILCITDITAVFSSIIGSVALALPIGTIIHEISITILSPFRKYRFFNIRRSIEYLKAIKHKYINNNADHKYQNVMVTLKAIKRKIGEKNSSITIDTEYIRDEIENRYSYYYARVDNGLFAPLFGGTLSYIFRIYLVKVAGQPRPVSCDYLILVIILCAVIAFLMLSYVPALLKEVDDLERQLVQFNDIIHPATCTPPWTYPSTQ